MTRTLERSKIHMLAASKTWLMAKKLYPVHLDLGKLIMKPLKEKKIFIEETALCKMEHYKIGKYASENGPIATVRKFQQRFPNMNESTARTFRKRYESDLADAKRQGKTPSTSLPLKPQGRPFLLGEINEMVQRHILAASNRGSVITRGVAARTAKALMKRNPHLIGNVDVESSHRVQSLYRRMGFRRRQATTSKLEIPEGALKEIKLLFHHDIVSKLENFSIPHSLTPHPASHH